MAEKHFQLDVVTPDRTVYSGTVQSFTAPGVIGSFQVLFNHAPLLTAIGIGEIKIIESNGTLVRFAAGGGFVEVKNNKVILLAESAEKQSDINVDRAEKAKERAAARLAAKTSEVDIERARLALSRSMNRLNISVKK